jgi:hypothetical protein
MSTKDRTRDEQERDQRRDKDRAEDEPTLAEEVVAQTAPEPVEFPQEVVVSTPTIVQHPRGTLVAQPGDTVVYQEDGSAEITKLAPQPGSAEFEQARAKQAAEKPAAAPKATASSRSV